MTHEPPGAPDCSSTWERRETDQTASGHKRVLERKSTGKSRQHTGSGNPTRLVIRCPLLVWTVEHEGANMVVCADAGFFLKVNHVFRLISA